MEIDWNSHPEYVRLTGGGRKAPTLHETRPVETCPYCGGKEIVRKGTRKNKYGEVQRFYCRPCNRRFSPLVNKGKSFPLRVILDAIALYNRLYTFEAAAASVTRKYGLPVSRQNVSNWIASYRDYLPFLRLRAEAARRYPKRKLVLASQLLHGQVYAFKYHRAKTALILERSGPRSQRTLQPLAQFLETVPRECPHELFRRDGPRASRQAQRFDLDGVVITPRDNAAVNGARFALQAVASNKLRHEVLQDFMLTNDSATVAVEVPIILDADDLAHLDALGYRVPVTLPRGEPLTGHIDIVQIRYGLIHILDYKPGARKVKPIEQLTIYALALSQLTGIRLNHFKCAWFDDKDYFDFFPRTVVQKRSG